MLGPPALETSGHVLSPGSPTGPAHISSRAETGPGHSRTCTQLPTFTKEAQPECFQSPEAGMGPPQSPCGWQVWAPGERGGRPQVRRGSDQSPRGSHSAERVGGGGRYECWDLHVHGLHGRALGRQRSGYAAGLPGARRALLTNAEHPFPVHGGSRLPHGGSSREPATPSRVRQVRPWGQG